jgi:histone deacetylase 1/2
MTSKRDTVCEITKHLNSYFNTNNDNKTMSIDEQYNNVRNKFAELCDISTIVSEIRSKYIEELTLLHKNFEKSTPDDTTNLLPNDNEPDIDTEIENKKITKNNIKDIKEDNVEVNTELTEQEPMHSFDMDENKELSTIDSSSKKERKHSKRTKKKKTKVSIQEPDTDANVSSSGSSSRKKERKKSKKIKKTQESDNETNKEPENETNKEPENESNKEPENETNKEPENETNKEPENETNKEPENETNKEPDTRTTEKEKRKTKKQRKTKEPKKTRTKKTKERREDEQ